MPFMDRPKSLRQQVAGRSRWFTLGLGLKRWLLVLGLGASVAGMGVVYLILILNRGGWLPPLVYDALTLQFLPTFWRAVLPLMLGGLIMLLAVVRLGHNLVQPFLQPGENVAQSLYDHSRRGRGRPLWLLAGGPACPACCVGCVSTRVTSRPSLRWRTMAAAVAGCAANWGCYRLAISATIWRPCREMRR